MLRLSRKGLLRLLPCIGYLCIGCGHETVQAPILPVNERAHASSAVTRAKAATRHPDGLGSITAVTIESGTRQNARKRRALTFTFYDLRKGTKKEVVISNPDYDLPLGDLVTLSRDGRHLAFGAFEKKPAEDNGVLGAHLHLLDISTKSVKQLASNLRRRPTDKWPADMMWEQDRPIDLGWSGDGGVLILRRQGDPLAAGGNLDFEWNAWNATGMPLKPTKSMRLEKDIWLGYKARAPFTQDLASLLCGPGVTNPEYQPPTLRISFPSGKTKYDLPLPLPSLASRVFWGPDSSSVIVVQRLNPDSGPVTRVQVVRLPTGQIGREIDINGSITQVRPSLNAKWLVALDDGDLVVWGISSGQKFAMHAPEGKSFLCWAER